MRTMIIKMNGKNEEVGKISSLEELVIGKGLSPERIVVEHNLKIIPREFWAKTSIQEKDSLEIVSFVGGG